MPWTGDIKSIVTLRAGEKLTGNDPGEQVRRLHLLALRLADFCAGADAIYIEEYAFSQGQSRAHAIGEAGGAFKLKVWERYGKVVVPVHNNSARKTLLQHVPSPRGQPKGFVKKFVYRNVRRLGGQAAAWSDDEADAFVVMNHGVMLQGGAPLSFPGE